MSVAQQCPDCGRLISFSNEATNLIACQCGTVLFKNQGQILKRPYYIIQQFNDIIQPGTEGKWESKSFKVTGRIRSWYDEFVFNYWTIIFNDGSTGYLGEGYGIYAIYEKCSIERSLTSKTLDSLKVGAKRDLNPSDTFLLERKYKSNKWELEGEAWLPYESSQFSVYEFAALDGRHIEVFDFNSNNLESFKVSYTSFKTLEFTHTRPGQPAVKKINCETCKTENLIKTFPYAQSFSCVYCKSRHSLKDGMNFKSGKDRNKTDVGTNITLGTTGVIKGILYEVIGYTLKEERKVYRSQWKEYTLYNPEEGFAFLSEFDGHWIYIKERCDSPVLPKDRIETFVYDHEPFQIFNDYSFDIVNSVGEFPYDIFNDDDKKVKEFISPPEVWIQEKCSREGITWFWGQHIGGKDLEEGFKAHVILPYKTGVGAVEPKGFVSPIKIAIIAFVSVVALIFAHVLSIAGQQNRVLLDSNFDLSDTTSLSYISERFVLDENSSNFQIELFAPVDNSWFELTATLVNAQNGTEYTIQKGVEYYHGFTDGENWAEGDRSETAYMSQIPSGTYYLQINGTREKRFFEDSGPGPDFSFNVNVIYDTANHKNMVVCLIALLIWPFAHYQLVQYNEKRRWSNSPYSPYINEDED